MEAVALHDINPNDESELPFKEGDRLLILNLGDPTQWYRAMKDGRIGIVPDNYIDIQRPPWYMGRLPRMTADQLLQSCPEGSFLVRLSESSPQEFSLSVKCGNAVQHFRILRDPNHKFFLWSTTFTSLNDLVAHYRKETVSKSKQIFLRDMLDPGEFFVQARYDFEPSRDTEEADHELGFKTGDYIIVTDNQDENWWRGRVHGGDGFFPASYVVAMRF